VERTIIAMRPRRIGDNGDSPKCANTIAITSHVNVRRAPARHRSISSETKRLISDYGYDATLHTFDKSARKPGLDRLICCSCISRCRAGFAISSGPRIFLTRALVQAARRCATSRGRCIDCG
jgi:hypothetical protein